MNQLASHTSVIITTYNDDEESLYKALSSVLRQKLLPFELIVVDDGSDDDTAETVVSGIGEQKNVLIKFYKKENGGPSSARNHGLKKSSSEYVTFLDSDDEMLPDNLLTKEIALMSLPNHYFGVYGSYLKMPVNTVHPYKSFDGLVKTDDIGKMNGIPGGVHTYLFKKSMISDIGGFDEALINNEDFDLIIRLVKKGYHCKGNLGSGFIRNYRDNSLTRNKNYYKIYAHVNEFLDKAERYSYFTNGELRARRKGNELKLAKSMLSGGEDKQEVIRHLAMAFEFSPPTRAKEWLAYLYSKQSYIGIGTRKK